MKPPIATGACTPFQAAFGFVATVWITSRKRNVATTSISSALPSDTPGRDVHDRVADGADVHAEGHNGHDAADDLGDPVGHDLGLATGRQFPMAEVVPYWVAQLVGGVVAVVAARIVYIGPVGHAIVNAPGAGISDGRALLMEVIATFLFVLVIQTVATNPNAPWKGVQAPVAIGGFIFAAALVVGPNSGGSFNPARSITPAVLDGTWSHLWV